jgi:hypothetical protein
MTKEGTVALDADRAHHPCGYVRAGRRVLALAALSPAGFTRSAFAVRPAAIGPLLATRSRYAR